MPHVSIYVPTLQRSLLPTPADTAMQAASVREMRLADIGNAQLPARGLVAEGQPSAGWNVRRTGAGVVLAVAGCCIAYWTFGRSLFVPGAKQPVAGVTSPPFTRVIDWANFDQLMRRSWG